MNHSYLRAMIGSTFVARRAGTQQERKATVAVRNACERFVDPTIGL